jgi:ADP-ribosyl-[dinitrogen reductase] hydrolase
MPIPHEMIDSGTLHPDLALAVSVAREAGALLRDEFHRPGGPRGHGSHAEIDQPVEELIRRRLLDARRADGFLGEETGSRQPQLSGAATGDRTAPGSSAAGAAPSPRRWIVDPNDGTSEFLKGHRGPSVSIALVVAGVPVIGVVYAYAAPDDRGDLIAGGRDLGLYRGRGTEDELAPQPMLIAGDAPGAGTVAVSSGAAASPEKWEANTRLCAPWTPRPVPGIAYRLALAAVGEVAVATTLTAPWSWDMAGGQALLLAAGGDLYTRKGDPVRYGDDGSCTPSRAYFGGHREAVERIRDRDWESIFVSRPGRFSRD